jgi:menaquinone-9 beta-reductase
LGMEPPSGCPVGGEYIVEWPAPAKIERTAIWAGGLVCSRKRFDDLVRRQALTLGAKWLGGCLVQGPLLEGSSVVGVHGTIDGEPITLGARLVIAADGAAAHLARRMGLATLDPDCIEVAGRTYFEGVAGLEDTLEVYFRPDIGLHYGWVFPVGDGIANVGLGTTFRQCRAWRLNLPQALETFLETQTSVRERFRVARQVEPFRGAEIRTGRVGSPACAPGILFVGDAASASDPLNGEGIRQAMLTGRLAAEIAADALKQCGATAGQLSAYELRLEHAFGKAYRESVAHMRSAVPFYHAIRALMPPWRERTRLAD